MEICEKLPRFWLIEFLKEVSHCYSYFLRFCWCFNSSWLYRPKADSILLICFWLYDVNYYNKYVCMIVCLVVLFTLLLTSRYCANRWSFTHAKVYRKNPVVIRLFTILFSITLCWNIRIYSIYVIHTIIMRYEIVNNTHCI